MEISGGDDDLAVKFSLPAYYTYTLLNTRVAYVLPKNKIKSEDEFQSSGHAFPVE